MAFNKPLNVWLLKDGETLPVSKDSKKMRTWRLGEALADRGHSVTWWTSNFSHTARKKICNGNKNLKLRDNFTVSLIDSGAYKKNISFQRIRHHYTLGKKFASLAQKEKKPDIIIASLPILEFPIEAIKYGKAHNIPIIIDVRDMWPDIFIFYFPSFLRPILRIPLFFYNRGTNYCLKSAQGIVSMSEDVLNWALNKARLKKDDNKRVFYIGYDENSAQEKELIKELSDVPKNRVIYGYLGTFSRSNKVETIINAAKILEKDESFNGYFIIAGDGENRKIIENKVKGSKNIKLLGWLNKGQSSYLMNQIDVSLTSLSSRASLFFPNKIFESLFFGKPMIFSMEGEAKELIEKNNAGVYFKAEDVNSLITSLKALSEKEKIKKMGENCKELYNNQLKSTKIYSNYCDYIEKIHGAYKI